MQRGEGFLLRPHDRHRGPICRCRNEKDESYRHCGCLDCRRRRNKENE